MIDHLRVAKAANFHVLKRPLSNAVVDNLLRSVRASEPSASQYLFYHRREPDGEARWSAAAFLYDRAAPFLTEDAGVMERACGFLLLVEHRGHAAIFKARLELPSGFASRYLGRVAAERVDVAVARGDAIFEKIRLRNMSVSKLVMRSKTLEASDLRNAVGPAASSRYAPQGYTVRSAGDHYSTTPSTGRIAQRSERVGHLELVDYARTVIDQLVDGQDEPAAFIRTFARPIDLAAIRDTTQPISFAFDVAGLTDDLYEHAAIRLVHETNGAYAQLTKAESDLVLGELGRVLDIQGDGTLRTLHQAQGGAEAGVIALNRARITLRDVRLPLSRNVEVERVDQPLGLDPERVSLRRYLDRENRFIVLFDDISLAYLEGTLFRDGGLVDGGADLLRRLRIEPTPGCRDQ